MPERRTEQAVATLQALTVLLVSRSERDRETYAASLRRCGLRLQSVGSPQDATIFATPVDAIVVDLEADDDEAIAVIARAARSDPPIPVIAVVDPQSARGAAASLHAGARRCLVKPLDAGELASVVRRTLQTEADIARVDRGNRWLFQVFREASRDLATERAGLVQHSVAAFEALAAAFEATEEYMAGHSLRVAYLAGAIAEELGCGLAELEAVRLGGRLHDIGMIGVPARILAHRGSLNPKDIKTVQRHVSLASHILAPFESLRDVRLFIEGHHERMDGSGYPKGVTGPAIPRGARILAVAEMFDAVTSRRPHRPELSTSEALRLIAGLAGLSIDPKVYEALRTVIVGKKVPVLPC
jgi:putative nucleotidyltransferase with HDIG domain